MPPPTPPPLPVVLQLRETSRRLVRSLGVVQPRLDAFGCTPAQAHVLIEVAERRTATVQELADVLQVDKSTASRNVRALLDGGLLQAADVRHDQRTKPVQLTDAGRERLGAIHDFANQQVSEALALLSEDERATVLRGVSLYERALHRAKELADVVIRPVEEVDDPALARLIREVMTEHGAVGDGCSIHDAEVDGMHAAYAAERSAYLVAERDGAIVAGAGFAPLAGDGSGSVCELRKMYVLRASRGLGLGRRLLDRCLTGARAAGFSRCYLETLEGMHGARALYEKAGFERLERPLGDTGHHACDVWYALELADATADATAAGAAVDAAPASP